jgi:predicted RNase H-like nuclease
MTIPVPAAAHPADAILAGIDGCRAGWIVCRIRAEGPIAPRIDVVARLAELFDAADAPALTAIDMPIGLPERIGAGGRGPERLIRPLLGERQSSVFSIPSRAAVFAGEGRVDADAWLETCRAALATSEPPKKVSRQGFGLFPKIRELDRLLDPEKATRIVESHPELAFRQIAGGRAMALPKKVANRPNPPGLDERRDLLATHGFDRTLFDGPPPRGAGPDDLLDACVLALVARRIRSGIAESFPPDPPCDARGLPVHIVA